MTKNQKFRNLHNNNEILHLGNVWDISSALMFEKNNYKAIGTSSSAIANSLGVEDGENISFETLFNIVKQIVSHVNIPLSVDIESGYSRDINEILNNIEKLYSLGIVGVNLEDSIVSPTREIQDTIVFESIIRDIKKYLIKNNIDIFLNIRTDSYILGLENPLSKTLERVKLYEKAGADGIFVPCIIEKEDIQTLVQSTSLPVNIMTMPDLISIDELEKIGVKRISQGPFVYNKVIDDFEKSLKDIKKQNSFQGLFNE